MQHLTPGTMLRGVYRVIRFISQGGFGCTYEVEHTVMGVRMAIKEFYVDDFCNRDATGRVSVGTESKMQLVDKLRDKFLHEARMVYQLKHPNIVRVSDVFEENGTAYFAMDYIDGQTLSDMIHQRGALPEAEALSYVKQICEALSYVHSLQMLHLDVKPGNIMVDSQGNAMLIDFGVSKQYDEVGGQNTSTLVGRSPGYAPVEQLSNNVRKFTPATDVYAMGATLYALLSGKVPPESTVLATGTSLPELPGKVSDSTWTAITKAMKINITERPQTIDQFACMLNGDKTQITIGSSSSSSSSSSPSSSSKSKRVSAAKPASASGSKMPWKWVGAVAALLLVVGAAVFFLTRDHEDTNPLIDVNALKEQQRAAMEADQQRDMEAVEEAVPTEGEAETEVAVAEPVVAEAVTVVQQAPSAETRLALSINIDGAQIIIDGKPYTADQLAGKGFVTSAGKHKVEISKEGYQPYEAELNVEASKINSFNISMSEIPTRLIVNCIPASATITIDGKPFTYEELVAGIDIAPGNHKIKASMAGYETKEKTVTVTSYKTTQTDINLPKKNEQMEATNMLAGHEYVDLGLPSGVKWATCNIGASTPEGYGYYFAWGETSPRASGQAYNSANSRTHGMNLGDISGKIDYDAARANWGSTWRLPTQAEMKELKDNTTYKFTSVNGVHGAMLTSKKNGKQIFLPAGGRYDESELKYRGEDGYYWSSIPNGATDACYLDFGNSGAGLNSYSRYYGRSIRPVTK